MVVAVNGAELPADVTALLVEGWVESSLNLPDQFVLRFNDRGGIVLAKAGIEIGAAVKVGWAGIGSGAPAPLIEGEVTSLELDVRFDGVWTVVRGLDKSHKLFRGSRVAAYQDVTASDVVQQIAQRASLQAEVDTTDATFEHLSQDGISDWELLTRLARLSNRTVTVSASKLSFVKPPDSAEAPEGGEARQNPLVLQNGVNLVALRATLTSAGQVPSVELRGWDPEHKQGLTAPADPKTSVAQLSTTAAELAGRAGAEKLIRSRPGIADQQALQGEADSLADHLAGGFAELEGIARGNPELTAGAAVELTGVADTFAGKYLLSATRHEFTPDLGYRTHFRTSNSSQRTLFGTASAGTPRAGSGGRPGWGAVVPALVTNAKDDGGLGRVKVSFPWLDEGYESHWARVVCPGAGDGYGQVLLPEVGDEVLVAFGGDGVETPYVIGGLFNGQDKPEPDWGEHVDSGSGEIVRRSWTSRKGMSITFVESSQEESVTIATNDGQQTVVVSQTDKLVAITGAGNIEIATSSGDLTLKAANIKVEATSALDLKGANVTASADTSLQLEGATTELNGSATTTVKGGLIQIN